MTRIVEAGRQVMFQTQIVQNPVSKMSQLKHAYGNMILQRHYC